MSDTSLRRTGSLVRRFPLRWLGGVLVLLASVVGAHRARAGDRGRGGHRRRGHGRRGRHRGEDGRGRDDGRRRPGMYVDLGDAGWVPGQEMRRAVARAAERELVLELGTGHGRCLQAAPATIRPASTAAPATDGWAITTVILGGCGSRITPETHGRRGV